MLAMGCFVSMLAPLAGGLRILQFWGTYEESFGVDKPCGFDFVGSDAP